MSKPWFGSGGDRFDGVGLSASGARWQGIRFGLVVVFLIAGWIGLQHNTEPGSGLRLLAFLVTATVVFAVALPAVAIQSRRASVSDGQKLLLQLIILPIVGYLSWQASTSVPIILANEEPRIILDQAEVVSIVRMNSAPCNNRAHVRSQQRSYKLCIEPQLSQRLEPGHQVELLVSESALGKRYAIRD